MREKFEGYIFKHAVQPLKLVAVVAIVAELSRRGLMFIGVPAFTSFITNMLGILIIMLGVSLDIENYCTIRASPACQRRCLRFLSAL
ncbi:hypothetical protein KLMIMM195B_30855 [Klebsiella michiganensis]